MRVISCLLVSVLRYCLPLVQLPNKSIGSRSMPHLAESLRCRTTSIVTVFRVPIFP